MRKFLFDLIKNVKSEIKTHPVVYIAFFIILLVATFVRVYNVHKILGFYYDQGRDALVIWDFWHKGDLFLVGPTTGIAGIFRGPWFYWLIAPLYLLGGGNPIVPAVFLSLTTILAMVFLYLTAKELMNREAGLIAMVPAAISYYIVVHSRWLSNPTPMLLISILVIWTFTQIAKGKTTNFYFPFLGFLLGMAMAFGSAAEVFYFPPTILFLFLYRTKLPSRKIIFLSVAIFVVTFLPQMIFDVLKGGVLSRAVYDFIFAKESFRISLWDIAKIRTDQYFRLFTSIINPGDARYVIMFVFLGAGVLFANIQKVFRNKLLLVLLCFVLSPLVGMLFFQGNYGNVFDYYYSGYYFPYLLLFALPLGYAARNWAGKIVILLFVILMIRVSVPVLSNYLNLGRADFTYEDQRNAVNWVFEDVGSRDFNVDVYVPPVIPYAYDYLFRWESTKRGVQVKVENTETLYTLYEPDAPAPHRLKAWLDRQDSVSKVEDSQKFGTLTVERRKRL